MQPVVRLFAVIVTYKMRPHESSTLRTLLDTARKVESDGLELGVLVWDNTPGGQDAGVIPAGVRYQAAPDNPGLARAYNSALETAHAEGFDWLLTLDQDSVLPANFLTRITDLARKLQSTPRVAAIVPQVTGDGRNLSPFQFALGTVPRCFRYGVTGIQEHATYAVNSAATLRVDALRSIGGYDPMFPLDISDINLFHRLQHSGKRVFVAGDLMIGHDFSLLKKHGRMSVERYRAMLLDECAFWDMNMGPLARVERMIRFVGRTCKDLLVPESRDFQRITLAELKRRLLTPRRRRIAEWTNWARMRYALSLEGAGDQLAPQRERLIESQSIPSTKVN
jgi:GT2 family glycosyltransferase